MVSFTSTDPVTGKLIKVSGFDGKPFQPLDWAFVPGTTSIVAQTADTSFYLIDPLNGRPTQPLGGHSRMYGFVPGSTTLIVDDNGDYKAIDLATGNTSTLAIDTCPEAAGLQQLLPLGGDRGYVGWVATQDGAGFSRGDQQTATFARSTRRIRIRPAGSRAFAFPPTVNISRSRSFPAMSPRTPTAPDSRTGPSSSIPQPGELTTR